MLLTQYGKGDIFKPTVVVKSVVMSQLIYGDPAEFSWKRDVQRWFATAFLCIYITNKMSHGSDITTSATLHRDTPV